MSPGRRVFAHPPRVRVRRTLLASLVLVGSLAMAVLVLMIVQAISAKGALEDAAEQARTLRRDIADGDSKGAAVTLRELQSSTTKARANTDGPLWGVAGRVPLVGDSVDAVRTVAVSLDDIAQRGIPPIVKVSKSLDADLFRPKDGAFDLDVFGAVAPSVATASEVLTENRKDIDAIDPSSLVGPLRTQLRDLTDAVGGAQTAASSAAKALRLAPKMLGGDGQRTYLLLFQNNAEARAAGGIPGSLAILKASSGRVELGDPVSAKDIGTFEKPVLRLTDDEKRTYGTTLGSDFRDTTLTPHFPRTAELTREMVRRRLGITVDGVASIDPVALSYALKGIGPVEVAGDTTLTADNAVDILLNTVYARYKKPSKQDAFFADSARRIFDKILNGAGNSRITLEGLAKSAGEGRILFWSADQAEEAEIISTRVGGGLVGESRAPHVGVYLSDSVSSKMQYYLRYRTKVVASQCTSSGVQHLRSTTTLRSIAPADAKQLPAYIAGNGNRSKPGTQRLNLRVFAPFGGAIQRLEVDGKRTILGRGQDYGRPVLVHSVLLEPGQKVNVDVAMTSGPHQRDEGVLTATPGIESVTNGIRFPTSCD